jgi:hypothetical protein
LIVTARAFFVPINITSFLPLVILV